MRDVCLSLMFFLFILPVLAIAAADPVQPQPAFSLVKGHEMTAEHDYVVGYRFSIAEPLTITDLGVFDQNADGVLNGTEPLKIGLWNATGDMLISAEIPLKTKPDHGAFYTSIRPLTLPAGKYVIAYASPETGERYWFAADVKAAPQIKWEQALYNSGTQLNRPTNEAPGSAYFGPVFKFIPGSAAQLPAAWRVAQQLSVTQPDDRAVFQRDAANSAAVPLACTAPAGATVVQVLATNMKDNKLVGDWTAMVWDSNKDAPKFTGHLTLPAGWYRLEWRAMKDGQTVATATVDHVGVGEVFLTCGQSNSCNHGQPRQKPTDDRVSACDWQSGRWSVANDPQPGAEGDGGSPWPLLGDLLVKEYDVPIGFISVGVGATAVEQWLPGTDLYRRIKTGLARAGSTGVRSVLWHQGEEDSVRGTSAEEYALALRLIIVRSRRDAGYAVPWGLALVSYHPAAPAEKQAPIIAGQKTVLAQESNVFAGPATDTFHLHDYMADGVHFNAKGLAAHAQGWADALQPLLQPVAAK